MYQTRKAIVTGAICGHTWMPDVMAGIPHTFKVRDRLARFSDARGATWRDILLSELRERGGDFQDARFSADTVVRVERVAPSSAPSGYKVHVWEKPVGELRDCADLVHPDAFTYEYCGD